MNPAEIGALFDSTDSDFAELSPVLWDPIGEATTRVAGVEPGDSVLDVCCGAGASALPAAAASGPGGRVDAVDLAESLLRQGRKRAARQGMDHLRFVRADASRWRPADGSRYDVVLCVHSVLLLPDLDASAARLVELVRPGGRFAVTTWANGALEEFRVALYGAAERERGPLAAPPARGPVVRLGSEDGMRNWLARLALKEVSVRRIPLSVPLTADLAWLLVLGTGFRGVIRGLDADATRRVRDDLVSTLDARGIHSLDATSLTGVGTRARVLAA
ncbi:class I SAM-dependent methyltransferase [Sphaerisporangium aureirubrum]|uniref:Class I SAM-dependent methyltransferase n=1 Tax=Sphaerisporangium aureirubrum TaxID=1544736 RepID=A0ABW1NFL4_9ACTN